MTDTIPSNDGEKIYNLIFNNENKKKWIYRVSENINIEDNKIIKKSISYDIKIPNYTLYYTPKTNGLYSGILARRIILPLTLQKKDQYEKYRCQNKWSRCSCHDKRI